MRKCIGMKRLLFMVNPVTAKSAVTPHMIDIIDLFEKSGYDVTVHISKAKGDISSFVTDYGALFDVIVCAGGDGTLSETISGSLKLEKRPKIGYIPSGTTNDFAKSWGIPLKPMEAARAVVQKRARKTDVSMFCGRPYVYVAAFGAFTEASYSTPQELKKSIGWVAYFLEGIKSLPNIRPFKMRFEFDGGSEEGEFLFGMISNTTHVGGFDLKRKSDISLEDGLMELILIRNPASAADNPKLISAVIAQDPTSEFITFKQVKHIRFTSEEALPWTVDGECGGTITEGSADIIEGAVNLIF